MVKEKSSVVKEYKGGEGKIEPSEAKIEDDEGKIMDGEVEGGDGIRGWKRAIEGGQGKLRVVKGN